MRWKSSVRPPWMPATRLLTLQPGPTKAESNRAEAWNSRSAVRALFSPCASVPRIWEQLHGGQLCHACTQQGTHENQVRCLRLADLGFAPA